MLRPEENKGSFTVRPWIGRRVGSRIGYHIFYILIRLGGRQLAYLVLYPVAVYYTLFRPSLRRSAAPYLHRRFPNSKPLKLYMDTYRMFLALGKVLIDRAIVGILGPQKIKAEIYGREKLLKLVHQKSGLVLLMSHVGCWQVALSALNFLNVPVNLLLERNAGDADLHYFEHAGISCPFRIIDPQSFLGGTLEMLEVLKKGEIVCMMGDRVSGSQKNCLKVDFLGEKATFPFSAFKLASAARVPIVTFFSYKTGPHSYAVKVSEMIQVPNTLGRSAKHFLPYVDRFIHELESFAEEYPYQFFNFYDLWS